MERYEDEEEEEEDESKKKLMTDIWSIERPGLTQISSTFNYALQSLYLRRAMKSHRQGPKP